MSGALQLSPGSFVTFTGGKFQIGHVDAPYQVLEIERRILNLVTMFAEPSDPEQVLTRVASKPKVREAFGHFLDMLHDQGVLTDAIAPSAQASVDLKSTVFEVSRKIEVLSDIGRLYPDFRAAWSRVGGESLSSMPVGLATWKAATHVVQASIPGAIVECGVWKGASMMLAALALLKAGDPERSLYLYDIFDWSWEAATGSDGLFMSEEEQRAARKEGRGPGQSALGDDWEREVVRRLVALGYPEDNIRTVRGKVQDTIPGVVPERIAVLRLDTDYYDSTR
ncbi:MAG: hypothetical protein KDK70_25795, partial [Myxococcales bacterium]|nr:hypothetical protein [Myxococcales bacterium]